MPADKEEELLEVLNENQTSTVTYLPRKKVRRLSCAKRRSR